jgi:chromate reductase, NAD(P)H dehydrogenase (quinone)
MADPLKILGIAGSLRKASYNRGALRAAQQLCPEGATLEVFELDGIPPFNQDEEQKAPARVVELKKKIREADAILFVTPEYNYGLPGVLKNAIDWASRPYGDNAWNGKPCALMSAAMSMGGGIRAQYQLRQCFVFLNMDAVVQPEVAINNVGERFDESSNLKDETSKKLIAQLLQNLVHKVRLARPAMKAAA